MRLQEGNRLLQLVQEQRLSGTIDQKGPGSPRARVKALAWLRRNYPVDEDRAILERLDREEKQSYLPQQNLGKYGIYGKSQFDEMRKRNEAKRQKEERERKRAEEEASKYPTPETKALVQKREERIQYYKKYHAKAEEAGLKEVPQMSFWRRVGPATLATAIAVSLCILFAQNYTPPPKAARIWPDLPPAAATIVVIVGTNIIVWLAWKVPPLWMTLNKHFCLVPAWPYTSSLIGNLFSHINFPHLAINMSVLWFVGTSRKYPLSVLSKSMVLYQSQYMKTLAAGLS